MSDEEEKSENLWMNTPRAARRVVYDHLDELVFKFSKSESLSTLVSCVEGGQTVGSVNARASEIAAKAFIDAIATLQSCDTEYCHDCGGFHDEPVDHTASMDPKELS